MIFTRRGHRNTVAGLGCRNAIARAVQSRQHTGIVSGCVDAETLMSREPAPPTKL
jgi:hypothetical protein